MQMIYHITLSTHMGTRNGIMTMDIADGIIEGYITLMEDNNYFKGTISEDGSISFSGSLKSLLSSVGYQAEGTLSEEAVTARIQTAKSTFWLGGRRSEEKKR